jgi:argininosuccinate lyase
MWGGHYASGPAAVMSKINACIEVDKRLYVEDILASRAHADMLGSCGILKPKDVKAIQKGLTQIEKEIESGKFVFVEELEDVHMNIEARLRENIGDAAGRLHTARSRNDQVAVDFRLKVRSAADRTDVELRHLQKALLKQAETNAETLMPGYTHLQAAQPVSFGHHLLAYVEMFGRDRGRFADARKRMNQSPLGAAALAGTDFPIDRFQTARALGFDEPMANSMDAVADRDFAVEYLAAAAQTALHLSRLAEEIVIWTSPGFGFVRLSEAFTTGSSIMPQKRNPDAAELIRGKSGAIIGNLIGLMTTIKGLPLTYNKDLQETKQPAMDAADTIELMIAAMAGMIDDLKANKERMEEATERGFLTATDLADWLVRKTGLPFREAHHVTGRVVRLAEQRNCRLDQLSLADMREINPKITREVFTVLKPAHALAARKSYGGAAPKRVKEQIAKWKKRLA